MIENPEETNYCSTDEDCDIDDTELSEKEFSEKLKSFSLKKSLTISKEKMVRHMTTQV